MKRILLDQTEPSTPKVHKICQLRISNSYKTWDCCAGLDYSFPEDPPSIDVYSESFLSPGYSTGPLNSPPIFVSPSYTPPSFSSFSTPPPPTKLPKLESPYTSPHNLSKEAQCKPDLFRKFLLFILLITSKFLVILFLGFLAF